MASTVFTGLFIGRCRRWTPAARTAAIMRIAAVHQCSAGNLGLQVRAAAFRKPNLTLCAQSGCSDFPIAAGQANPGSANLDAPKLPLASSPYRPLPDGLGNHPISHPLTHSNGRYSASKFPASGLGILKSRRRIQWPQSEFGRKGLCTQRQPGLQRAWQRTRFRPRRK
jgi:hypothetical protein